MLPSLDQPMVFEDSPIDFAKDPSQSAESKRQDKEEEINF